MDKQVEVSGGYCESQTVTTSILYYDHIYSTVVDILYSIKLEEVAYMPER